MRRLDRGPRVDPSGQTALTPMGVHMAVLKLWVEAPLHQTGTVYTPGRPDVTLEAINCTLAGVERRFTLLSLEVKGESIDGEFSAEWQTLHDAYELIAFAGNSLSDVVASRVEPDGIVAGVPLECEWYRVPPPIATLYLPFGLPSSERLVWHNAIMSEVARGAISWYLRALRSSDPFERLVFLWTVLEGLSPQVSRPAMCPKCHQVSLTCSRCGPPPSTPGVLKSILALCAELPGVTSKEIREPYGVRSAVVHGQMRPDFAASSAAGKGLLRLWEIAHLALKHTLGWSRLFPPVINFEAGMAGNWLRMRGKIEYPSLDSWKHPLLIEFDSVQMRVSHRGHVGAIPTLPEAKRQKM